MAKLAYKEQDINKIEANMMGCLFAFSATFSLSEQSSTAPFDKGKG